MGKLARVGIIGAGMGRAYIKAFVRAQETVETTAVVDLDEERLEISRSLCTEAGAPEPQCFTDYHEMLKLDEIEFVVVATPNFLHAPMAVDALRAGKHVLIEKPPSNDLAGTERIAEAVRETGGRCMIGLSNRFRREIGELKKIIERGETGDIYFAKARWTRRSGIPVGSGGGWFGDRARSGGGPLIDLGVHVYDLTWWLMGCPKPVSVTGATYDALIRKREDIKADVEDLAAGFVRFANGASLFLETSWAGHVEKEIGHVQLLGTEAGLDFELFAWQENKMCRMSTEVDGVQRDITFPKFGDRDWRTMFLNQFLHFLESVREDKPNMADAEQGLELMRVLCGLYESAKTGREVVLDT